MMPSWSFQIIRPLLRRPSPGADARRGHRHRIRPGRWAVGRRRFYVRDPFGKLVNILSHR